jgi:hypothetical protein
LDAGAILALSNVDGGVVSAMLGIDLDARLGVGGLGSDKGRKGKDVSKGRRG